MELLDLRPRIGTFYRVVEGTIDRAFIPAVAPRPTSGLIFILEGSMRYRFTDESELVATEGDILFLARGSFYSMELVTGPYRFIFANFDFVDGTENLHSSVFSMQNARVMESQFRRMLEKWRLQKPGAEEDCLSILYAVYAELLRQRTAAYIPATKRTRLDAALQYISDNFANEGLKVEDAAKAAGMGESHFRRLFKSAYAVSPIKYICLLRVNRAKEYIRYSSDSFAEIAQNCGFASVYYFSRIFKKEAGCTPGEYRAKHKEFPEI